MSSKTDKGNGDNRARLDLADLEAQHAARDELPNGEDVHPAQHDAAPRWRSGTLDNLRWNAGNREFGQEDEGSVHSSRSRAASRESSRHGGSQYEGSRRSGNAYNGSYRGGTAFGDRSYQTGRPADGSHHGANSGGVTAHVLARNSAGREVLRTAPAHAFVELPGQGGPLQDNAGLSASSMEAQAPHHHHHDSEDLKERPQGIGGWWRKLWHQLEGGLDTAHPRPKYRINMFIMPFSSFLGILWVAGINRYTADDIGLKVLTPSFGASAVLLFAVPESKLSQPRNFLGGQFLSVIVGCIFRNIFPVSVSWVAAPVSVGVAVFVMMLTRTVHPPGGATALLAASVTPIPRWAGWSQVPALMIGCIGMQIIALVTNIIAPGRRYPTFWWGSDNFFGGL